MDSAEVSFALVECTLSLVLLASNLSANFWDAGSIFCPEYLFQKDC